LSTTSRHLIWTATLPGTEPTHGQASVAARLAEHLDQDVRRAVDDRSVLGELGHRVDDAVQVHEMVDAVQIAQLGLQRG
jgi:hypothetical protein